MATQIPRSLPVLLPNRPGSMAILCNTMKLVQDHMSKLEAMACGFMIGSSALAPIICSPSLELGNYLKFDLWIWLTSTICFGVLNQTIIAKNAPIVIGMYFATGFLAFWSPRPSLKEMPPWIPLTVAMSLLLSVSVIPWLRARFQSEPAQTLSDLIRAGSRHRINPSQSGTVDPNSTRSDASSRGGAGRYFSSGNPEDFAHFGHMGIIHGHTTPAEDNSDIDLEEGIYQRYASSSVTQRSEDSLL